MDLVLAYEVSRLGVSASVRDLRKGLCGCPIRGVYFA